MSIAKRIVDRIESRGYEVLGIFEMSPTHVTHSIVWVSLNPGEVKNLYNGMNYCTWECTQDGCTFWGHYFEGFNDSAKNFVERISNITGQQLAQEEGL